MYDFFTHQALLIWSIIFTIIGWVVLFGGAIFITHDIWVLIDTFFENRNPDNNKEDNS